jgi:hypothetical protein
MKDYHVALGLLKARLNRMPHDTTLDDYLTHRLIAVDKSLERIGIHAKEASPDDLMLVVDWAAFEYGSRDTPGAAIPDYLRLRRRERWLAENRERLEGDIYDP